MCEPSPERAPTDAHRLHNWTVSPQPWPSLHLQEGVLREIAAVSRNCGPGKSLILLSLLPDEQQHARVTCAPHAIP